MRRLLLAAEDLRWLDPATVGVLRFIGRRLEHDPAVLLARPGPTNLTPPRRAASYVLDLKALGADDSAGSSPASRRTLRAGRWPTRCNGLVAAVRAEPSVRAP